MDNLTDNHSVSVSYQLSDYGLLGIQANYNKSLDQAHSYHAGAFYQREIGSYRGMRFFINAAYNKALHMSGIYSLSVNMNFYTNGVSGTESLLWQAQRSTSHDDQVALPIVAQGSTVYSQQNEQGIGYTVNEIHTFSSTVSSLAGIYNYTAPQGFMAAYVNYQNIKGGNRSIGYGGNLETEFAMNQYSSGFTGVGRGNASGMIVRADASDGQDQSSKFALLDENNRKIAVFPANKSVFVSLPGFTDQNYTLMNLSKADYLIISPTKHVTLYPGNIGYYSWSIEKRIIVIGRAVTTDHRPLSNRWVHVGDNGIFSDNEGNFQLELSQNTAMIQIDNLCKMKLPHLNINKAYLYLGEIVCS